MTNDGGDIFRGWTLVSCGAILVLITFFHTLINFSSIAVVMQFLFTSVGVFFILIGFSILRGRW